MHEQQEEISSQAAGKAAGGEQEAPEHGRSPWRTLATVVLYILGADLLAYGVMIAALGTGSLFFLFWFVLGFALLFWGLAVSRGWTRQVSRGAKIAAAALGCVLACMLGTAGVAIMQHIDDTLPAGVDYVIVPGAQVTVNGPAAVTRLRLDAACAYLNNNSDTICIVSGGQGPNEPWPEADGMRDYLVQQGISPDRILCERTSESTLENLEFSAELIPEGSSVGIVTNNFHVFRCLKMAERLGLSPVYGQACGMSRVYLVNNVVREMFAITVHGLLGQL